MEFFSQAKSLLLAAAALVLQACGSDSVTQISAVNVSSDSTENRRVAGDLTTFDYRTMIIEKLGITDEKVLNDITWFSEQDPSTGEVNFKVEVGENAKKHKKEIEDLFSSFVTGKVKEYHKKMPEMDVMEQRANYYIDLIAGGTIDSLWLQVSPSFSKFTSKADFKTIMDQRAQLFMPSGNRHIKSRKVATEIGPDLKGEFCTIIFAYENQAAEEVTLEKHNGVYKLLGYHFVTNQ
jgi:hypothetical protein